MKNDKPKWWKGRGLSHTTNTDKRKCVKECQRKMQRSAKLNKYNCRLKL
jgi:hypothetical protein